MSRYVGLVAKAFVFAVVSGAGVGQAGAEAVVTGGVTPSVRPAGAPAINAVHYGVDWYRRALTGVSEPYPRSLYFMDNQGEWYTPFTRPGMVGRYDIRKWHK